MNDQQQKEEEIARHREYSERTAREVDREVASLLENEEVTGARVYELLGEPEDQT